MIQFPQERLKKKIKSARDGQNNGMSKKDRVKKLKTEKKNQERRILLRRFNQRSGDGQAS